VNNHQIKQLAFKVGALSFLIGSIAFLISWFVLQSNMPGYRILLFPGNLFLQLFTEELNFGLKLVLLLAGQFGVSSLLTVIILKLYALLKIKLFPKV